MFRAQRLLLDPERPLEQGYRLVVLALVKPEPAVVGRSRRWPWPRTDGPGLGPFPGSPAPGCRNPRLPHTGQFGGNVGQVVERLPDVFVFRPLAPLANGQGLLEDLFRLFETAQFPIEASQLVEGLGVLGVVFPNLFSSTLRLRFRVFSASPYRPCFQYRVPNELRILPTLGWPGPLVFC